MGINERNSAHELLRILAMFLIVWYHLVLYWFDYIPTEGAYDFCLQACMPTLHIGVILFVLITGYYGIKPSISGFLHLLFVTIIYFLPIEIARDIYHHRSVWDSVLFITNTPYWFIRTYLFLYLVSPLINKFIAASTQRQINYMLLALGVVSIYFGTTGGDMSIGDGKNVVNFMFLYLLGNVIHSYQPQWEKLGKYKILIIFVLLNISLFILLFLKPLGTAIGDGVWQLSFPYCSPLLILNATLLFMVFSQLHFHSRFVNYIASSMLAVYLIHGHPFIRVHILIPAIEYISRCTNYGEGGGGAFNRVSSRSICVRRIWNSFLLCWYR